MYAIINGVAHPDVVAVDELSQKGQVVLAAIGSLVAAGAGAPFPLRAVYLASTDVLGSDRADMRAYFTDIADASAGASVEDILRMVRDKQLLVELINEAGSQLRAGRLDPGAISSMLGQDAVVGGKLRSVADAIAEGLPPDPQGFRLASLPRTTDLTGGVYGMWAVAGEPGSGKSTLAWQLSLDIGRTTPVLYYDFENGFSVLMQRTRVIFGGDFDRIRGATSKIFVRDSIRTLESDLGYLREPALIVIDSVQKLPTSVIHKRGGLDSWVHRIEGLKKRGYSILLISEVPRISYNNSPGIGDFKETGEIEYAADLGMRLLPLPENNAELHIVKNRHKPHKGFVTTLHRKRDWLFEETPMSSNTWESEI